MRRAIVTVVTRSHWHRASVLLASVAHHVPDAHCAVVLVDRDVDGAVAATVPSWEVIEYATLLATDYDAMCGRYVPFELAVSAKPWALAAMLARGYDEVMYLDADMQVLAPLEPVFAALADTPVLLTPHRLRPRRDDAAIELLVLRAGLYNAGFVAVRAGPVADAFVAWWQQRLREHCIVDPDRGLVGDQRWLDLAPVLFEGVGILRDEGVNVGRWNLDERPVAREGSLYTSRGAPLRVFHFSGLLDEPPTPRSQADETGATLAPPVSELVAHYRAQLAAAGEARWRRLPFGGMNRARRAPPSPFRAPAWLRTLVRHATPARWRRSVRRRWLQRSPR